jgi:hypothetical protein
MRAPDYPQDIPVPDDRVPATAVGKYLSVLLVEDDRADALLVEELIADAGVDITFGWAQSVADAEREVARDRRTASCWI